MCLYILAHSSWFLLPVVCRSEFCQAKTMTLQPSNYPALIIFLARSLISVCSSFHSYELDSKKSLLDIGGCRRLVLHRSWTPVKYLASTTVSICQQRSSVGVLTHKARFMRIRSTLRGYIIRISQSNLDFQVWHSFLFHVLSDS